MAQLPGREALYETARAFARDLVWRRGSRVRVVVDAKCKSLPGVTGPSGDMHQALAYCVALALPRCWLVYAACNETPRAHTMRHLDASIHVAARRLADNIARAA